MTSSSYRSRRTYASRPIWPAHEKYNVKEHAIRIEGAWGKPDDAGQRGVYTEDKQTLAKFGFVIANVVKIIGGPSSCFEKNMPGKQRKERENSITFFLPCYPTVFSPRLASDVAAQIAEVMPRFVVAGEKHDECPSFLIVLFCKELLGLIAGERHDYFLRTCENSIRLSDELSVCTNQC